MKRLQIYLEPEADEALAAEAARDGTSKAAIIRRLISEHTGRLPAADPLDELMGAFHGPVDDINAAIYDP
jgi:hypothetical protein